MDKLLQLISALGDVVRPLGGFAKALELVAACLTLIVSIVALRRIKKAVTELKESADDVTNSLEAKMQSFKAEFSELADSINDQFVSTRQVPAQQAAVEESLANWNEIRSIWRLVRERVESKVLNISDGRVRKKYASKDWRDYADIIRSLEQDKKMTTQSRDAALEMYRRFNSMRYRQAQIASDEVFDFARLAQNCGVKMTGLNGSFRGESSRNALPLERQIVGN